MTSALLVFALLGVPAAEPYHVDSEIDISFPEKMGDFVAFERKEYTGGGLGYDIRYRTATGAKLNLYVFDAGLEDIGDGKNDKSVKLLFDQALAEIRHVERMGYYKDVKESKVGEAFSETVTSRCLGKELTFQIVPDKKTPGPKAVSYLFGTGYKGKMLKIRCTVLAGQKIDKELNEFLESFLALLEAPER